MGGAGNPISAAKGGTNPLAAASAGPMGGAFAQLVEKCTNCLKCLKDKLCSACTGGLKDGDEKALAADEQGEGAWKGAMAFLAGQGTGYRMAIGAEA